MARINPCKLHTHARVAKVNPNGTLSQQLQQSGVPAQTTITRLGYLPHPPDGPCGRGHGRYKGRYKSGVDFEGGGDGSRGCGVAGAQVIQKGGESQLDLC